MSGVGSNDRGSILGRDKQPALSADQLCSPLSPVGTFVLSQEVKCQECKFDHLHANAEVQSTWTLSLPVQPYIPSWHGAWTHVQLDLVE